MGSFSWSPILQEPCVKLSTMKSVNMHVVVVHGHMRDSRLVPSKCLGEAKKLEIFLSI